MGEPDDADATPGPDDADPTAVRSGDPTIDGPVALRGVRKGYGPVTALDGIDLSFAPGALHCLAGPNGSGKTTALRLIAGLTRPSAGTVAVPDAAGAADSSVGISFQQPSVYPGLTARQNLDVFAGLTGAPGWWRETLVERLRLEPALHRQVGALSDGFTKKLDVALALLKRPAVVLLDEPLADLDDLTRGRAVALLDGYARPGRVVVVSSHRIETFGGALDRLTVVRDGELVRDVSTGALEVDPARAYQVAVADHAAGGSGGNA